MMGIGGAPVGSEREMPRQKNSVCLFSFRSRVIISSILVAGPFLAAATVSYFLFFSDVGFVDYRGVATRLASFLAWLVAKRFRRLCGDSLIANAGVCLCGVEHSADDACRPLFRVPGRPSLSRDLVHVSEDIARLIFLRLYDDSR